MSSTNTPTDHEPNIELSGSTGAIIGNQGDVNQHIGDVIHTGGGDIVGVKNVIVGGISRQSFRGPQAEAAINAYRQSLIEKLSTERYKLDTRFVNLTLSLDRGKDLHGTQLAEFPESFAYSDLHKLLAAPGVSPLVILGAPGSGKSTLLRKLQLDDTRDRMADGGTSVSFFVSLSGYRGKSNPLEWLRNEWDRQLLVIHTLPSLDDLLQEERMLLLLDALNEMPHEDPADFAERVRCWQDFLGHDLPVGNRVVFSCRSLDYTAPLRSEDVAVPRVNVRPLDMGQIRQFLEAYLPTVAEAVWKQINSDSKQLELFSTPYFLKLLTEQIKPDASIPKGRAALFTGFVQEALQREFESSNPLLMRESLFTEQDRTQLNREIWDSDYQLPWRGALISKLGELAYKMQINGVRAEGRQVRVNVQDACELLSREQELAREVLNAGIKLNILDEDLARGEILFAHQLLQEYFAARTFVHPLDRSLLKADFSLFTSEWRASHIQPNLEDVLADLTYDDPLSPTSPTGWEETMRMVAEMVSDPNDFVFRLAKANLPLAALCLSTPGVSTSANLQRHLQQNLITRTQNPEADLRARISAGLALGKLGDPRFEKRKRPGSDGDYLLPPLIEAKGGNYMVGTKNGGFNGEKPVHQVTVNAFKIGQFPVTNGEYALFIKSGGYEDDSLWDSENAKAWLTGEYPPYKRSQDARQVIPIVRSHSDDEFSRFATQIELGSIEKQLVTEFRKISNTQLSTLVEKVFPLRLTDRQPQIWHDPDFSNPLQPVVGVCWYEARAYCAWLSAQSGTLYRLPSEVEWEVAARGGEAREFSFGNNFGMLRCNTLHSHIRRTSPIGIFPDGNTPEGIADMCGNVWEWTNSTHLDYPYHSQAERDPIGLLTNERYVVRGGAWDYGQICARAAFRESSYPYCRSDVVGFRVVKVIPTSVS